MDQQSTNPKHNPIFATQTTVLNIVRYTSDFKAEWNAFIEESINGCFLHDRNFMEYHADRFEDHSLMIFEKDVLVCCFPAHEVESTLYSHLGLTYASLITKSLDVGYSRKTEEDLQKAKKANFKQLVITVCEYAKQNNFDQLDFKLSPNFYDIDFDLHYSCLLEIGFKIREESLDLVVDLISENQASPKKTAGYRNGKFDKLKIVIDEDFNAFWNNLLVPQLQKRHHSKPTHTIEEIQLLQNSFPTQILQYNVGEDGSKVAGVTLFDFGKILKVQYAAANETGFKLNAMDFLYLEIIKEAKAMGKTHVDLGTVNNPDGTINQGLLRFKKQLGATPIPVYEIVLNL